MSSPELLIRIEAAKRAVLAQTALLHREFGRTQSEWKSDGTRVTAVDLAISEGIVRELRAQFPDDDFFSEELTHADGPIPLTRRFAWVLDPIDGTNNYALGIAHCAISLGLLEDGQPAYGVVYDMSRHTLMHGGPGFGMHDGERMREVSAAGVSLEPLVGFHGPVDRTLVPRAARVFSQFKIRALGSSALHMTYVAAGIFDGCIDFNVRIWDIAAAVPLVWAAKGEVQFLNGEQFPMRQFDLRMNRINFVAGRREICERLREIPKT